ncbi:MAG TPA: hypothetical protein VFF15_03720 [Flavobacteriaceae bacterium]|nr:hypothetical protein [Flavobacteriaceae bacterium]
MKKVLLFFTLSLALIACKEEPKGEVLKGEFVYLADAAVLQTETEIYAVVIDEKMHELDNKVKPFKSEDTDMIPVEIRGIISPKPEGEEGWDYRVKITEILNVSKPNPEENSVIKIGN